MAAVPDDDRGRIILLFMIAAFVVALLLLLDMCEGLAWRMDRMERALLTIARADEKGNADGE